MTFQWLTCHGATTIRLSCHSTILIGILTISTLSYHKYSFVEQIFSDYGLTTTFAKSSILCEWPTIKELLQSPTTPNITADKPSRTLSTLSPVPENLRTPDAMATPASRLRNSENRLAAKKDLKREVTRLLNNDRNALRDARNKAEDLWYRLDLEPDVLEEKLVTAAMDKLAERRAAGQDIGAVYSAFENYIPPIV